MSAISTHVLDTAQGRPAVGVAVSLARKAADSWTELATATTDANGRVTDLLPAAAQPAAGIYRLRFDVGAYFAARSTPAFYPYIDVVFEIRNAEHHHVPLLVSPFGYATYRGS